MIALPVARPAVLGYALLVSTLIVAAVQTDVVLGDRKRNLDMVQRKLRQAASQGARLVVFPECALSGYCFDSAEQARLAAEPVPGPATEAVASICRETGATAIFGLIEEDGDSLYNSAAVIGPEGLIGVYRKTHLPFLGVDRFLTPGSGPLVPFDTPLGKIGVAICYDASFPEVPRTLKLRGAQIIVLPTNWPEKAVVSANHQPIVRAHENHVHFVAVNRIGTEGEFKFVGLGKIVDCKSSVLAAAEADEETLLLAEIDVSESDRSRVVHLGGKYELDRVRDRRPELYSAITDTDGVPPRPEGE